MFLREAETSDIPQIHRVRTSVRENALSNPDVISFDDYVEYLTRRGKGWLCEADEQIVGFAIDDLLGKNIWALFVHPEYERKGIGKMLHEKMLDWYFAQTEETVWLGTSPKTRAEIFYAKAGWERVGIQANNEMKFEISFQTWKSTRTQF